MAYLDRPRKNYRLIDRLDSSGKIVVVIRNLGIWKGIAHSWLVSYEEAVRRGFTFKPPISIKDIEEFLAAKKEGREPASNARAISVEEMVDLFIRHHGPSVKGGIQEKYGTAYYNFKSRMNVIKRAWTGKYSDTVNKHDVRDLLALYTSVGTHMRLMGAIGKMFRSFYDWNEEGNVLSFQVKLPPSNPVTRWRKEMKPAQKREHPDKRVLDVKEWEKFRGYLKPRTLAICEMTLRRFLRLADIKRVSRAKITNGYIQGLQEKTGEAYSVPMLSDQPEQYDFTNFKREFEGAQVSAGMNWPAEHPLHFSFKDLRRTGATWAWQKTRDLVGISAMLGHTNIKTTMKYLQIRKADLEAIAAAVDHLVMGKLKTNV